MHDGDITGEMFIKAEWKNNGPTMPPIKSENLFKKPKCPKNRNDLISATEFTNLMKMIYIDVNDPRNEEIIEILREEKNEFMKNLLN